MGDTYLSFQQTGVYGGKLGAKPGAFTRQHDTSWQNCQRQEPDETDGGEMGRKKEGGGHF